ncbi:hypothetical protein OSI85_24645, partial [Mycobacterium ulcerans]
APAALGGAGPIGAGLGNASALGKLSVPPSWPGSGLDVPPSVSAGGPWPATSSTRQRPPHPEACWAECRWPAAPGGAAAGAGPRYGFRVTVMARPPFAG